ncbi:MAG: hypothetical protein EOP56_07400 [Sphingobacteriales bacterium]|nr:MAG: hypothetical protein EOP56_07400 [Sphingobacteriales bacterium]
MHHTTSITGKTATFLRKGMAASLLSFLTVLISGSSAVHAEELLSSQNPTATLRGAELYLESKGEGKIVVYLKKYYDYNSGNISETETISVQETGTMLNRTAVLSRQSMERQEDKSVQTPSKPNAGIVSIVVYSKEIDLGREHNSYDLTWGYVFPLTGFANTDNAVNQGFSLTTHFDNDGSRGQNSMPSFSSLPPVSLSPMASFVTSLKLTDPEQDKVVVELDAPQSLTSTHPGASQAQNTPAQVLEGTVVTDKAPFRKLELKIDYTAANPLKAKSISIAANNDFRCTAGEMGKYLMALSVKEYNAEKLASTHQLVFIVDVK